MRLLINTGQQSFELGAVGADDVLRLQVKANRRPGAEEMAAMAAVRVPANVRRIVHRWQDRASVPAGREPAGREID